MAQTQQDVTILLAEAKKGDPEAISRLMPLIYAELRKLASGFMNRERVDHTLQPTALVHEAYLKLLNNPPDEWENRAHFFGIAAQAMRHILIDHARGHSREKRGAGQNPVSLEDVLAFTPERSSALLGLDESLRRLT